APDGTDESRHGGGHPKTAQVSVTLTPTQIAPSAAAQATATAKDATGHPITGLTPSWASSNTAVATVSASGVVLGVAPGTASIQATVDGVSGSASITVAKLVAASVSVSIDSTTLSVPNAAHATAVVRDSSGAQVNTPVSWHTSNAGIASVSSTGVVQAVTP